MVLASLYTALKIISLLFVSWLVFAIVGSTAPFIVSKKIPAQKKRQLAATQFEGDAAPGPDRALVIESPADALNIRLVMARSARKTLDIVNHRIKDSRSTRTFLGELLLAARRGVKVRLLVDGKSCLFDEPVRNMLRTLDEHPNIICRLYNPVHALKPWRWHALLHDKFILADDDLLLLGGRNIDERHFAPSGFAQPTTHDRDVFVWQAGNPSPQNPGACSGVSAYMGKLWAYQWVQSPSRRPLPPAKANACRQAFAAACAAFEKTDAHFYQKTLQDYLDATVETDRITLLHNPIEAETKEPWLAWQLSQLIAGARREVILQTPYATCGKELLQLLTDTAAKAELRIITNSAASSPNLPAFSCYFGQRQAFLDTGAAIYEYQCRDSIHGKSLIIDDRLSAVGSLNMDARSFYIDTETMLVIDSPHFARQLNEAIENIRRQSLRVGADNRYLPSPAVSERKAPIGKQRALKIVNVLLRPFRFLL